MATTTPGLIAAGVGAFGALELALAIWMIAAPHSFFTAIGPFGGYNRHYIRDAATFEAALGFGLLVAVRKPAWRVPALAITLVQFALHSVNHLLDIGASHPAWPGYFDFFSLAAATLQLAWLLAAARAVDALTPSTSKGVGPR